MNRESLKWLLIGLGSAAAALTLIVGGGFSYFQFLQPEEWPEELLGDSANRRAEPEPPTKSGMDYWMENEARYLQEVEDYGLRDRYTVKTPEGEWREVLYQQGDFLAVEAHLKEKLAVAGEELGRNDYGAVVGGLGSIRYGDDFGAMRVTLNSWIDQRPGSHYARLVLGQYLVDHAWNWRGSDTANTVTEEAWQEFSAALEEAREVLEEAYRMRPDDPEAPALLVTVALGLSLSPETMEGYYEAAIAAAPYHFGARSAKLQFLLPKWYGTWQSMDVFVAECLAQAEAYPLLHLFQETAYLEMHDSRPGYEDVANQEEVQQEIIALYEDLLQQFPDLLWLQCNYAHRLYRFSQREKGVRTFEAIGDRFHNSASWGDIRFHNRARAVCHANYALELEDDALKREHLERAIELAPYDHYPWYRRGEYYLAMGREDEAVADFHTAIRCNPNYRNAYIKLYNFYNDRGEYESIVETVESALEENLSDELRGDLTRMRMSAKASLMLQKSSQTTVPTP